MRIAFIILSILRLFTVSMNAHAESIPSSAAYQLIHSKEGFQFQQYPTVQFAALQQWICDNQEEDDSHTPECHKTSGASPAFQSSSFLADRLPLRFSFQNGFLYSVPALYLLHQVWRL